MKRFLSILAVGALLLPALQLARGADVSVNLFYDNLNGGNWYEVSDYGYVWQPDVATDSNWRPYTDGYWAYTDQGWTWVSYEDFGWATYHYGRWARLTDYGWVWVPGSEWAPAWVSWRTGGDYIGWAPLPPSGGGEAVYESRPITPQVDVEFGIGPAYYNFVDLRYIGEPVLRDRIVNYNQNVTIINNTVNVTNITYNNSTVYNYGPDYARVSAYSVRPIQRLKLQRQNVDAMQAVRNGSITKVQGNQLVVAAPMRLQKANAPVAPKQVKAKIEQPKVEKGWSDVTDPGQKTKLEQQFKSENAKNVPKPNFQPNNGRPNAIANEAAAGAPVGASPAARAGKGKNRRADTAPSVAPVAGASTTNPVQPGKRDNRARRAQAEPAASPATGAGNQTPVASNQPGAGKHNKANQGGANAAVSPPAANRVKPNREPATANADDGHGTPAGENPHRETQQRQNQQREKAQRDRAQLNAEQRNTEQRNTEQRNTEQRNAAQRNAEQRNADQRKAEQRNAEQRNSDVRPPTEGNGKQNERPNQQERNRGQLQNAPEQNQPRPAAQGRGEREQAEGPPQGQPQGGGNAQGPAKEKEKAKGKKPEAQQSPTPQ